MNKNIYLPLSFYIFAFFTWTFLICEIGYSESGAQRTSVSPTNPPAKGTVSDKNLICEDCNLIFISMTNVRQDHLGFYGYSRNTTPNLDEKARESIVFENAYSVASWTLPVSMSIYTSTYPFTHKVMTRRMFPREGSLSKDFLPDDTETLVDILKRNGYKTATFNGGKDYLAAYGLTNRFDTEQSLAANRKLNGSWAVYGSMFNIIPATLKWLDENHDKKFFLHVQTYDAHCPFAFPEKNNMFDPEYKGGADFTQCYWTFEKTEPKLIPSGNSAKKIYNVKLRLRDNEVKKHPLRSSDLDERDIEHMVALYDGEIFNIDKKIKSILQKIEDLGLSDNTIIVFLSEHGDMFGKYGLFMRGGQIRGTFYDDVLHIPLMIYHPHSKPNRIWSPISLVDLAPTVLDFLGISKPLQFEGQSMVPLLLNDSVDKRIFAGAQYTPYPNEQRTLFPYPTIITAVRSKDWKLIRETIMYPNGSAKTNYELFNIKQDPDESHNLALDHQEKLHELDGYLGKWMIGQIDVLEMIPIWTDRKFRTMNFSSCVSLVCVRNIHRSYAPNENKKQRSRSPIKPNPAQR